MYQGLRESMIRSQLGHIQLFKQGFNQFGALSDGGMLLPEPLKNRIVAQVQALPGVEIVTPRPLPSLIPCRLSFVVFLLS